MFPAKKIWLQYSVQLPKGLSFNIFKAPSLSNFSYGNFGAAYNPPPPPAYPQIVQNKRSKPAPYSHPQTYPTDRSDAYNYGTSNQQRGQTRQANSRTSRPDDSLIYQTSASTNSDLVAPSTDSSMLSDLSTLIGSPAMSDDVSSTMASSSTETLQSTLVPLENPRLQTPSPFYPPRNQEERAHDRSFPPVTQIQRPSNSFKLSTQLNINNHVSSVPRLAIPNHDPVMRPSSRQDRGDSRGRNPVPDMSRRATVEDYESSSSSSASDTDTTVDMQFVETEAPRSLSSISETADRPGRTKRRTAPAESRLIYSGREHLESTGHRDVGFGPRPPPEKKSRNRAMSTNSMPLSLKVEVPPRRSVRWKDELICPSPIPRRTGWFNRRG